MAEILNVILLWGFFYVLCVGQATAFKLEDLDYAKNFLNEFHYLSPEKTGNHDLKTAVELFQRYMHLPVTGDLDENTITEMNKPRCGFPDIEEDEDTASPSGRTKRFAVAPWKKKWNKTSLTYAFVNYGDDMTTTGFDSVMKKAFKIWADRSQLSFKQVRANVEKADIKISFGRRTHDSCGYPFDGPGTVLGHAFYPPNGNIHFDDDEDFTDGTYSGKNLLAVAVHEIGHVIGIGHSSVKNSVMYPQYRGYDRNLRLQADDINAAAYLYGGGTVRPKTTQSTCADRLPHCPVYKNFCTISSSTKIYCPFTCDECPSGGQVASCVDIYRTSLCRRYSAGNHCKHPMVGPNCKKSCNLC